MPWLTSITLTPFAGAIICALASRRSQAGARRIGIAWSLLPLLIALACALTGFNWSQASVIQCVERHDWITGVGAEYFVGIDGLGWVCVLLAALIVPFASALTSADDKQAGGMLALMLTLQGALFGTFTALNFVHWFLYWEIALIPAFFLIKQWGGKNRTVAAYRFFVYTMVGSAAMLLGMVAVFRVTGTFDLPKLATLAEDGGLLKLFGASSSTWLMVVFACVLLGFAVKVPLFPFHTWLPDAYAEAPTPVTMVLTGVMSKMGVYGFLRILLPIFHAQIGVALPVLYPLALAGIVFSAWAAMAQTDIKRVFAYSSINHLGYCLLAIFAACGNTGATDHAVTAVAGSMVQLFNHGITASALFAFVALLERRSGGLRGLNDFGGLRAICPALAGMWGIAMFSSLGLPGLNGFIGEYLIFQGVFSISPVAAAVASAGLLFTALFLLGFWKKVFHGPANPRWACMPDLSLGEKALLLPSVALMFVLGLDPQLLMSWLNPVAQLLVHGSR